ncbi:hypothetical protein FHU31_000142 [Mycolicibacterium fluoranthenivorans]|uniref:Uncharacterized protein n=1 Tax=Mycolicibacterium fluoranthenivorans TaxID=258505 RepID=A0A7X5R4M7_9MYCO|nr:hypothetical protein [Mycolicibacterium fluoranthenivorans]
MPCDDLMSRLGIYSLSEFASHRRQWTFLHSKRLQRWASQMNEVGCGSLPQCRGPGGNRRHDELLQTAQRLLQSCFSLDSANERNPTFWEAICSNRSSRCGSDRPSRSIRAGTGGGVRPDPLTASPLKSVHLAANRLIARRDPSVAEHAVHAVHALISTTGHGTVSVHAFEILKSQVANRLVKRLETFVMGTLPRTAATRSDIDERTARTVRGSRSPCQLT